MHSCKKQTNKQFKTNALCFKLILHLLPETVFCLTSGPLWCTCEGLGLPQGVGFGCMPAGCGCVAPVVVNQSMLGPLSWQNADEEETKKERRGWIGGQPHAMGKPLKYDTSCKNDLHLSTAGTCSKTTIHSQFFMSASLEAQ